MSDSAVLPETPQPEPDPGQGTKWLTPGVWGIGLASLLADSGHEITTSLLPSLLTSTFGAPAAALGLVEGVADGAAGLARLLGGALADDPARRRSTAVGGYATTAVLAALLGASSAIWQVGLLRIAAWTARGLRVPARNALLADLVPPQIYGRAYGFERAMDNVGAIIGPVLALALITVFDVRVAMLLSVVPGLLAAGAILYAIRHIPRPLDRARRPLRLPVRRLMRGPLGRLLVGVGIFEIGHVATTLLILRATQLLTPGLGATAATQAALGLYIAYNVAATGASIPAGRIGDQRGPLPVLIGGVGLFFVGYLGLAIASSQPLLLGLAFVVAGVAIGCVETAQHAAIAAFAPADLRGSAFGMLAAVQSFGQIAASAVAGAIWTAVSPAAAFGYLAAWAGLAVFVLLRAMRPPAAPGVPAS